METPSSAGAIHGVTHEGREITVVGYKSMAGYVEQAPGETVDSTTVVGAYNFLDLDQEKVRATQNFIAGSSNFISTKDLQDFHGNVLIGYNNGCYSTANITSTTLIGMGASVFETAFVNREAAQNITALTTAENYFSSDKSTLSNILILGNATTLGVANQTIVVGAGGEVECNGQPGIVVTQGSQPFNNAGFSGCCTLLGSAAAAPTANDQLVLSHSSIRGQNLQPCSPSGNGQQLVVYDTITGLMQPASSLGAIRRLFSTILTTDAKGEVSYDFSSMQLTQLPHVVATVVSNSRSVFHGVQTAELSPAIWIGRVFNCPTTRTTLGMTPVRAGVQVHVHVSY